MATDVSSFKDVYKQAIGSNFPDTAVLKIGDTELTQPVQVRKDPRLTWVDDEDLRAQTELIEEVAATFPDLQIVMAHPSWPWQDEALAVARHKTNVWIDLSGWSPKYLTPELLEAVRGPLLGHEHHQFGLEVGRQPVCPAGCHRWGRGGERADLHGIRARAAGRQADSLVDSCIPGR